METESSTDPRIAKLREYLAEVEHLTSLRYDNQEKGLWVDKVRDTLNLWFGEESDEYKRFHGPRSVVAFSDDAGRRTQYLKNLSIYEADLMSVIQLCELKEGRTNEKQVPANVAPQRPAVFIAHGGNPPALTKLEEFIEALGCVPVIAEKEPSQGRSVDQQVDWCMDQSDCAIVLNTAENLEEGKVFARPNVLIELGRFQERFPSRTIYLLEKGAKFPTNVDEKVWAPFTQDNMEGAFLKVVKEFWAFGFLRVEIGA